MSGLGSSSSFAVGLLKLLGYLKNINYTRHDLATLAIHLERDVLKENVGVQDQTHAAYGGLNRYEFSSKDFTIHPVRLHSGVRDALNNSMFLIHTGVQRYASEIVKEQVERTKEKQIVKQLDHLCMLTRQAHSVLEGEDTVKVIAELGAMIHDSWMTKRSLSSSISNDLIDSIYETVRKAGAVGGKLCGAGGGGFFLVIAPPDKASSVQTALGERQLIPIKMDDSGATIILS